MFGNLIRKQRGPHIRREDGFGNHITAGLGCLMSRGAGRHITMVGGFITEITGAGGLDRFMWAIVRCGLRHLYSLLASAFMQALVSATSDGSQWGRMITIIPGTDAASIT